MPLLLLLHEWQRPIYRLGGGGTVANEQQQVLLVPVSVRVSHARRNPKARHHQRPLLSLHLLEQCQLHRRPLVRRSSSLACLTLPAPSQCNLFARGHPRRAQRLSRAVAHWGALLWPAQQSTNLGAHTNRRGHHQFGLIR